KGLVGWIVDALSIIETVVGVAFPIGVGADRDQAGVGGWVVEVTAARMVEWVCLQFTHCVENREEKEKNNDGQYGRAHCGEMDIGLGSFGSVSTLSLSLSLSLSRVPR